MAPAFRPARARRPRSDTDTPPQDDQRAAWHSLGAIDTARDAHPPSPPLLPLPLPLPSSAAPTPVLADGHPSTVLLDRAIVTSLVPAGYGTTQSGPSPGTVVGITLGAVAGFLLFIALIYACVNVGTFGLLGRFGRGKSTGPGSTFFASTNASSVLEAPSYISRREREHEHKRAHRRSTGSKRRRHSHRSHRSRPVIVDPPMERVVVEERIRRTSRPGPPPRARPTVVETTTEGSDDDEIVVEEEVEDGRRRRQRSRADSHGDSDDEVVVIEEDTSRASRPRRSSRGGSRLSSRR